MSELDLMIIAWLKYQGQKGTDKQIAKFKKHVGILIQLPRMLAARGIQWRP